MSDAVCETVAVTQRGRTFNGDYREGEVLLQTTLRLGVLPRYSCMTGECGSCMVRLTEGSVRMQDNWSLSETEVGMGYVLLCQSFPTSQSVAYTIEE